MPTVSMDETIADKILDAVQIVDREHDFTDRYRGAEAYFSDSLRDVLLRAGSSANRECGYQNVLGRGRGKRCDLFADIDGQRVGLEIKLLFPTYWSTRWPNRHRQRLFEPFESFPMTRDTHTAALDLKKLATCGPPPSDYLGLLVVASHDAHFDTEVDFAKFSQLARIDREPWVSAVRRFPNTFWNDKGGYQLDARIWLCPSDRIGAWWEAVKGIYSH